jgi:hypothetical protein
LLHKAVHNWVEKLPPWWQTFRWWQSGWNGSAEVAEITVKGLLYCGFRCDGKAMGQCINVGGWYVEKLMFFFLSRFEYHMFCVLYPFVTDLLTLPRTSLNRCNFTAVYLHLGGTRLEFLPG